MTGKCCTAKGRCHWNKATDCRRGRKSLLAVHLTVLKQTPPLKFGAQKNIEFSKEEEQISERPFKMFNILSHQENANDSTLPTYEP